MLRQRTERRRRRRRISQTQTHRSDGEQSGAWMQSWSVIESLVADKGKPRKKPFDVERGRERGSFD